MESSRIENPRSKQVAVWLTKAELAVLEELMAATGSYRSAVIRQAIAEMAMRHNIERAETKTS